MTTTMKRDEPTVTARQTLSGANGTSRSVAGFDFQQYNRDFLAQAEQTGVNNAAGYGVGIASAAVAEGEIYWRVIGIHHLLPRENNRRHNAYIEVLDEQGIRLPKGAARVGWIWEGKNDGPADPKQLEKPANEPAADIPLEKNMTVTLWLEETAQSDRVTGLHTRHDDESDELGSGNAWGHHSYYIVFQRTRRGAVPAKPVDVIVAEPNGWPPPNEQPTDAQPAIALAGSLVMRRKQTIRIREKLGIDANAPILPDGRIAPQVADPAIIADTGVGWVRLNFIRGPWQGPTDTTSYHGHTWLQAYRQIVANLRGRGLQIYGLVGHEMVDDAPGDQFRNGVDGPISNSWIGKYAATFAQVAELFRDDVTFFETFNEPDDWNDPHEHWKRNWIHPTWLAVMLQAIHDRVRANPHLQGIKIISGPVEGFDVNHNAGVRYLEQVYYFGKQTLGWGRDGKPIPFHGIGYHLYIAEGARNDVGTALREKYQHYMAEMRGLINREDPAKPVFISEIGWRNDGGLDSQQRAAMDATVEAIATDDGVALGFWFCTQDFPGKPYGVYHAHGLAPGHRKAIYDTLQQGCARLVNGATVTTATEGQKHTAGEEGTHPLNTPQLDAATYVLGSDRIKDHTLFDAGAAFEQRWSMTNSGATTWGSGYQLVHVDGFRLGAPLAVPVPACAPGGTVAITVPFGAPTEAGAYMSTWQLANAAGQLFGERIWTVINVAATRDFIEMPGATARGMSRAPTARTASDAIGRAPIPVSPVPGKPLAEADPELYAAWRDHMRRGFENNQVMFEQVLAGFMNPYWTTVWMYRILFGIGVAAFVVAALVAVLTQGPILTGIFGGLSMAAFLGYFLNRPLQALEENLQFITWLGIIYNSYWTRLAYTSDLETVQTELEDATDDAIAKIKDLMDKHGERNASRPGFGR